MILQEKINLEVRISGKPVSATPVTFSELLNIATTEQKGASVNVPGDDIENVEMISSISDVTLVPGPAVTMNYIEKFPKEETENSITVTVLP